MNERLFAMLAACLMACAEGQISDEGEAESEAEASCLGNLDPAVETCDGIDNDCDGEVDEDFNFQRDSNHCGGCNISCHLANAESVCQDYECRLVACHDGFWDANQNPLDGCEYGCERQGDEVCDDADKVDEDCDGLVNEACDCTESDERPCGSDVGVCERGTQRCVDGQWSEECEEGEGPAWEICDGLDNDCDNEVDESPREVVDDPQNCGRCGFVCEFANATPWCDRGVCHIDTCDDGWWNWRGGEADGCEYACVATGDERCDGVDNDCNGTTDEGCCEVGETRPCGSAIGACEPGLETCVDGTSWGSCEGGVGSSTEQCDGWDNDCDNETDEPSVEDVLFCEGQYWGGICDEYPREVECQFSAGGGWERWCRFIPDERFGDERCDGIDNDCDGEVDEGFAIGPCSMGEGVCQVSGQWACQDDGASACSDRAGRPLEVWLPAVEEDCGWTRLGDGLDNDCDGEVDEGCGPPEVTIACADNGANLTVVVDGDISLLIVDEIPAGESIVTLELGLTANGCWESGAPECPYVVPYMGDDVAHVFERVPYTWFTPRIRTDVGTVRWLDLSSRQVRTSGNCDIVSVPEGTFVNGHAS